MTVAHQPLRILLVGAASSPHLLQWAAQLVDAGHDAHVASLHPPLHPVDRVPVTLLRPRSPFGYVLARRGLRRLQARLAADVVHVHYATGYGLLGRLACSGHVLSVWGTDVFEFPARSPMHRWFLMRNLRAARVVTSTSRAMSERIVALGLPVDRVRTVPFGFDPDRFQFVDRARADRNVTVGTVKTLDDRYGIDLLLRAFARARSLIAEEAHDCVLRLVIAGDGPERMRLEVLANEIGLSAFVEFVGRVPHADVPNVLARLDIFVALSRVEESFGLAVVEAAATGLPSIVSAVGGFGEVVDDGVTGILVPREDVERAALALILLATDPERRLQMGRAARTFVMDRYTWARCVSDMTAVYRDVTERQGAA